MLKSRKSTLAIKDIHFLTTENGEPKAAVVDINQWRSIVETLKITSNKELIKSIKRAKRELRSSKKLLTHQEVFENL